MATRANPATRAERRARTLAQGLAETVVVARTTAGLSLREVARRAGLSGDTVRRVERGEIAAMSIRALTRIGEVLGLELAATFYPSGDPVRDSAHLALLARFRARLRPGAQFRTEVPIPIAGDRRSGDAMLDFDGGDVLVEAETHLGDVQLLERKAAAKQRDLGADHLILLVADTRHNRRVINLHPELHQRFPVGVRSCLARLGRGQDPGGDCLVVL